jgi:hypothetical protein
MSRGHLIWLSLCGLGATAWAGFVVIILVSEGGPPNDFNGPLGLAGFLLLIYTLPVTGVYVSGIVLRWLVLKLFRTPRFLARLYAKATGRLDAAALGYK